MIQRYSIYADGYYSIDESENGLYCLYADAEKWMRAGVLHALADQEIRDGEERAEMVRHYRVEIATLKEKINQLVNTKP